MNKAFLVAFREYKENITTKTFWIGIISFPLIIGLSFAVPILLERNREARKFAVLDQSGWLWQAVENRALASDFNTMFINWQGRENLTEDPGLPAACAGLGTLLAGMDSGSIQTAASYTAAEAPDSLPAGLDPSWQELRTALRGWWQSLDSGGIRDLEGRLQLGLYHGELVDPATYDEDVIRNQVASEEIFAFLVIGPDPVASSNGFKYYSRNLTDEELKDWFLGHAGALVRPMRFQEQEIDQQVAMEILSPLRFAEQKVTKSGEVEEVKTQDTIKQWLPVGFVYILWIAVFSISQMLLTNTIEEKSNRIIEVLLSSVSPMQLMLGKVFGILATGLTILLSWVAFFLGSMRFGPTMVGQELPFDLSFIAADPVYLTSFVVYFILGYLLYGAVLVGMGAVCNSLKEAQNLMQPVVVMLLVPLMVMLPVAKNPNGMLAKFLSYIPPFTPFVMMNRAAGPPTAMEYLVTGALLVSFIGVTFWASAKVFRIGILMTGKPPKLKEIIGWVKAPVGSLPPRR